MVSLNCAVLETKGRTNIRIYFLEMWYTLWLTVF